MKQTVPTLGSPGFLPDPPDLISPPGSWTDSRNVRYRDGAAEKCKGYEQALGTLSATAIWTDTISDGQNSFWVYGGERVLYATDGTNHADVGALSLTYGASADLNWTGGAFNGYLVACDAVHAPESWTPGLGNRFTSLTAWPAITAQVIRPFKDFLFAFRITDGGTYNPRLMRWSDAAPAGALPLSWDYTDPTNQAGITELGQTDDIIVDALALRDSLMIYKQTHTWIADYVGGADIFGFRKVFDDVGMLTTNCAQPFKAGHVVWTPDDIVVHDGNTAKSIIDQRARRWLFNRINVGKYRRCFIASAYRQREFWFCFPEQGADYPTLALVWNWSEDTLHPIELGGPKSFGRVGIIPGSDSTFDSDTVPPPDFDDTDGMFDEQTFGIFAKPLVLLDALAPKAYQTEAGEDFAGSPMHAWAERTGIGVTEDLGQIKRVNKIWPRIKGTVGDRIDFYVGAREALDGPVNWTGPYLFTIGVDSWIDCRVDARVIDLRVEYAGNATFRFVGWSVDYDRTGAR